MGIKPLEKIEDAEIVEPRRPASWGKFAFLIIIILVAFYLNVHPLKPKAVQQTKQTITPTIQVTPTKTPDKTENNFDPKQLVMDSLHGAQKSAGQVLGEKTKVVTTMISEPKEKITHNICKTAVEKGLSLVKFIDADGKEGIVKSICK